MYLGGSLPCLLGHIICLCSEPDQSNPRQPLNPISWRSISISVHPRLGLPSRLFFWSFPTKIMYATLVSSTRASCLAHLILFDVMTRIITNFAAENSLVQSTDSGSSDTSVVYVYRHECLLFSWPEYLDWLCLSVTLTLILRRSRTGTVWF